MRIRKINSILNLLTGISTVFKISLISEQKENSHDIQNYFGFLIEYFQFKRKN